MIELRQLTKRYGDFTAVNAIDLTVPRGELFGFLVGIFRRRDIPIT